MANARLLACILFFVVVLVAACSQLPVLAPTAEPVRPPSPDPFPSPTGAPVAPLVPTPEATPSPSPTATPGLLPTATPGPLPVATPVPARPAAVLVKGARHGGTLNLVSHQDIVHQDVHQEVSPALSTWGPGIAYGRLLRFRSGADVALPSLGVECELCESWRMENERTFVFRLRDDVMWQDIPPVGGRALTSDDVVFSYDRQRQVGWPNAPLLQGIRALVAPHPDTVRISLAAPDADFMASLADGHSKIVAKEAVELNGDLRDGPTIGTGPWILTGVHPGNFYTFESNPTYFEEGLPFVDRLVMHIITEAVTRDIAFKVKRIDVHQMDADQWEEFQAERPSAPFLTAMDAGTGLEVALKVSGPPFDDMGVRSAVFQAMDPWRAIQDVWRGFAFVSLGFPVAQHEWLLPEQGLREFFGHPDLARDLLRESGAKIPVPVAVKVGDFGEAYLAHGQRIADELAAVGFEPRVEIVNRRAFGEEVWLGGDYQMLVGPTAPVTRPNGYLLPVLHSRGRWNTTEQRDEELDRLIEAQAQEYDSAARGELARQIQRRVLERAYRFMPATRVSIWTWWPRVQNFDPNFAGFEYSHWAGVWVKG